MHDAAWDRAIDDVCSKIASDRVHHFLYKRNGAGTPGGISEYLRLRRWQRNFRATFVRLYNSAVIYRKREVTFNGK